MGGKTTTTTQQYAANPAVAGAYTNLLNQAQGLASNPYQAYTGELTAPINQQQNLAIGNINSAAGQAQPYINQASQYATNAASPISNSQIQQYMNPYTQNVINSTMALQNQQNQIQQNQLTGNAALQGAFGGDRTSAAQALLAGQQSLANNATIAGLQNQNYSQALGEANTQQQNQMNAANTFANLGTTAQNAALQGAGAQLQAGTLQQQTAQSADTAAYQQYLQQLAYPYQQLGFLSNIASGAGNTLGGTQTTQTPQPSVLSQIAGIGLGGLSVLGGTGGLGASGWLTNLLKPSGSGQADGGAVTANYATGGATPFDFTTAPGYVTDQSGYVPQINIQSSRPHQFSNVPQQQQTLGDTLQQYGSALKGAGIKFGGGNSGAVNPGATLGGMANGSPLSGSYGSDTALYAKGGLVDAVTAIRSALKAPRGIHVKRYDDGGAVDDGQLTFEDRAAPVRGAIISGVFDQGDRGGTDFASPYAMGLPPQITNPDAAGASPATPMSFASPGPPVPPEASPPLSVESPSSAPTARTDTSRSTDPWLALAAAGFGMASGASPYFGVNAGRGALEGLNAYTQLRQQAIQNQRQQEELAIRKTQADLEGRRLAQQASQFGQTLGLDERKFGLSEKQYERELNAPKVLTPGQLLINPQTGKQIAANDSGLMSDQAVDLVVDRLRAGDKSALQNIGRGAQSGLNLTRIQNRLAERAAIEGWGAGDMTAAQANLASQGAAARTAAVREANVQTAIEEAKNTFPLVREASANLPRSQFVPWNRAVQIVQSGTSSPELAAYVTAMRGAMTAYSQAMSRTGTNSVHAQQAAEELLRQAAGPQETEAVLSQMEREMNAALVAPDITRKAILSRISGREAPEKSGASQPPSSVPKEGDRKQFKQGWGVYRNGQWAPERP